MCEYDSRKNGEREQTEYVALLITPHRNTLARTSG
jgi:hypothetical protein